MVEKNSEENPQTRFEVKPFKYLFRFGRGLSITKNDLIEEGFPVVNYGEIHSKCKITTNANKFKLPFVSLDYLEKSPDCLCNDGTVIFADTSEDVEGAGNFTQISGDAKVFAGYHCVTAVPTHDLFSKYVPFALDSLYFRNQIRKNVRGVKVYSVTRKILGEALLPIPSYSEQRQIVAYLHRETAKIDNLISKQKKLIALLMEKRRAVISQAVTKGLDPNVETYAVPRALVEALPKTWQYLPLKRAIFFQEGPGILAVDFQDEGVPLIRISGTRTDKVTLEGCNYLDPFKVRQKWSHFKLKKGDLLISGSASMGNVCEVMEEAEGAIPYTGLIRINCRETLISKEFLTLFLKSDLFFKQIDNFKTGSTIQHFGPSHLNQMYLCLPTLAEQKLICTEIEEQLNRISNLIDKAARMVELSLERRQALIAAAVTGKIDVRDLVTDEEVAALDAEVEREDFDVDGDVEDLNEPELASEEE